MQFLGSFNTFDPIDGYFVRPYDKLLELTDAPTENNDEKSLIFDSMAARARAVLVNRTSGEISEILSAINWLLSTAYEDESAANDDPDDLELRAFVKRELQVDISQGFYTPASLLKTISPVINVEGVEQFSNATWKECFAVIALATLGDIHRVLGTNGHLPASTVALAAEAMEALALAEGPARSPDELDQPLRKQISLRNQQSAITGHAAVNAWKEKFCNWVANEHIPSLHEQVLNRRAAAKLFIATHIAPALREGKLLELEGKHLDRIFADSLTNHPRFKDL
jgi:hypothetical protein